MPTYRVRYYQLVEHIAYVEADNIHEAYGMSKNLSLSNDFIRKEHEVDLKTYTIFPIKKVDEYSIPSELEPDETK
ncbi:MAG: hypothetical protein KGZ39_01955 [Simkania sp.]|nr:hypothetical protein [Simkania sp.]